MLHAREHIPTINDVAALARVSKRTVSRVLNKSDAVNANTRRRVQAAIEQLNFTPSSQARGLAARQSFLLGLVYDVPTLFINQVQNGLLSVCAEEGYDVVVHPCEAGSRHLTDDVRRFIARSKVEGIIMLPPVSESAKLGNTLTQLGVPYVRFAAELTGERWRLVVTNYVPAVTAMTDHLVALGHRDFGFISGPAENAPSQMRQQAFADALSRHGLRLENRFIAEGAFTYDSGLRAAGELLARPSPPTAIFAANDEMAVAVMNVANAYGMSIPADLSVVGFDGTAFTTFVNPALSTILRPSEEMARLSARKLLTYIHAGPEAALAVETMVSPQFVARDSTGPAPKPRRT